MISLLSGTSITIATLTFSLTVLSIQIAAQTYSPRLLDDFLKDPVSKIAVAVNLGSYAYAFTLTYFLNDPQNVPNISIHFLTVQVAMVLTMFVYFIHYFVNGFRLESILHKATEWCWAAAEDLERQNKKSGVREFDDLPTVPTTAYKVLADSSGYVAKYKLKEILKLTEELDLCVRFHPNIGEFVAEGTLLAYVWDAKTKDEDTESEYELGAADKVVFRRPSLKSRVQNVFEDSNNAGKDDDKGGNLSPRGTGKKKIPKHIRRLEEVKTEERLGWLISDGVEISTGRSGELDVLLGVQQLTDVAVRALSPGVNDPVTAIQALDYLSSLFGRLAHLDFYINCVRDERGFIRCSAPRRSFTYLLSIPDPIRSYGGKDLLVNYRLIRFYGDLGAVLKRLNKLDRIPSVLAQMEQCMVVCRENFKESSQEFKAIEDVHRYALALIAASDRPTLQHDESVKQDLNDLETTYERPTKAFVNSLPPRYKEAVDAVLSTSERLRASAEFDESLEVVNEPDTLIVSIKPAE